MVWADRCKQARERKYQQHWQHINGRLVLVGVRTDVRDRTLLDLHKLLVEKRRQLILTGTCWIQEHFALFGIYWWSKEILFPSSFNVTRKSEGLQIEHHRSSIVRMTLRISHNNNKTWKQLRKTSSSIYIFWTWSNAITSFYKWVRYKSKMYGWGNQLKWYYFQELMKPKIL